MRILIAEDDDVSRMVLRSLLMKQGYEVVEASNGADAWSALLVDDPPKVAILDWLMPEMYGVEVCRQIRATPKLESMYVLLLTSRDSKDHIIEGLQAGANDYVTKPFDRDELLARLGVGVKVVQLQTALAQRVQELEQALHQVQQLHGLLPICSYCKSVRDDQKYWHQVDAYLTTHSDVAFSHGVCPKCWKDVVRPALLAEGITVQEEYPD
jgi:sigma-B regulation protein RsbU (phosphoserine phosphatase)